MTVAVVKICCLTEHFQFYIQVALYGMDVKRVPDRSTNHFGGILRTMATPMKKRRKTIKIAFDIGEHYSKDGNEHESARTKESPLWMKHLENIKQMRSKWDAPVD
ncbi:unnamed protein product, partial [Wuchereria bancrofti]